MTKKEEYSDLDLIKLFRTRENFEKYHHFVLKEAVLEETWIVLDGIKDHYKKHPASSEVDWPSFRSTFLLTSGAKLGKVRTSMIANIIDAVIADPKPSEKLNEVIEYFVNVYHATRCQEHVDKIIGGKNLPLEDLTAILDQFEKDKALVSDENLEDILSFSDMAGVYDKLYRAGGLEWRLEDLNVTIGPPHPGDLIAITACPNVGKTRLITSEITHFLSQLKEDERILFINNEETKESIWNAIYASYFNKTDDEIVRDMKKYDEKWRKEVPRDKIAVFHKADAATWEIEKVIKAYKPHIVVYNQLYKVILRGHQKATEPEQYRLRYNFGRVMADKYKHIAITAHQAGAVAAGEKIVTQEMMYGSKSGIPGECDVIIGVGKTYNPKEKEMRYLYIARNKLPSGPRTIPDKREDTLFSVKFVAGRGRYETIEFK